MIGELPKSLCIKGRQYEIRSDFRDCLRIMEAYGDADLTLQEKHSVMLQILYKRCEELPDTQEAAEKGIWFLNCGDNIQGVREEKPLYDWKQDEQMIFSAINKTAGCETRQQSYIHWWTFVSYFYEIGEGMFSSVVGIRSKLDRNRKLNKAEQEFYKKNREMIDLKKKYSKEQREEMDRINRILG